MNGRLYTWLIFAFNLRDFDVHMDRLIDRAEKRCRDHLGSLEVRRRSGDVYIDCKKHGEQRYVYVASPHKAWGWNMHYTDVIVTEQFWSLPFQRYKVLSEELTRLTELKKLIAG